MRATCRASSPAAAHGASSPSGAAVRPTVAAARIDARGDAALVATCRASSPTAARHAASHRATSWHPPALLTLCALLVLLPTGCASPSAAAPVSNSVPATDTTISQLEHALASGRTTARAVTEHYIARITTIDSSGPSLHSVLEVNPDASAIASKLDASHWSRDSGDVPSGDSAHGPLFGVPVLLKDNIDTSDRMLTTAGSLAMVNSKPARDAFIVTRLRASGAVILGKTNLSEWANFRSTRSSSGWSGRGGQTRNPYSLDRNPCGSSSGSGAAIAAELAVVAIGSETDGSIVCPSSANGLVGIKPTIGLVSRSGIIPISASQDTAGPMARTVADAAAVLTVIAGYDPDDPATSPLRDRPPTDYTRFLDASSLKGARIGVMRHSAGFHEKVDAVFEQALAALRAQGAMLVDPADIPNADKLDADEQTVLQYEFKDGINRYLSARRGEGPRTLTDLITYNSANAAREMPYFGQELFIQSSGRGPLTDSTYIEAHDRAKRLAGPEGIDAALAKDHLDVLIAPTLGPAWTTDLINGDHFLGGGVSSPPAIAGYPHITVPMGAVDGLPIGLSFVGPAWSEARLISLAYAFEQSTHARRPPNFLPSIP